MAQIDTSIFRSADIRGRVNDQELNVRNVNLLGKAYGTFLERNGIKTVVVGYDSRACSEAFNQAMIDGLVSTGREVISIGMALSPMVYWAQYYFESAGAVMITGSHNPPDWSGFKMAKGYSYTLVGDEVQQLRRIIENDEFVTGEGSVRKEDITEAYYADLLSRVKITRPFKIVMDTGNGTAGKFAPELYRRAGCEVKCLFCDLDTSFPNHFPDPTIVESREDIIKELKKGGYDLGILFDGDGDRLGANTEDGEIVWSDTLMILWSRDILAEEPGASIVFDVKCSQALVDDIREHGGNPIMWRTGHPFIKSKLKEVHGALAGEMSGHIFFVQRYYGFDDALYAGLRLLEYLSKHDQTLGQAIKSAPQFVATPEIRVHCPDDRKYEIANDLARRFKEEGYDVIDIDGARVNFGEGWGLCRASSNLPHLILRFEAKTEALVKDYMQKFKDKMNDYPEVDKYWENAPYGF